MIPDFHDGYLDGLLVSEGQTSIFLRTVNGEKFTLALLEVERLYAENFREGNIVFSVEFQEAEQANSESIQLAYGYSSSSGFSMEKWTAEAKKRGLRTMEISSSHGCTAVAVFKEYELVTGYRI